MYYCPRWGGAWVLEFWTSGFLGGGYLPVPNPVSLQVPLLVGGGGVSWKKIFSKFSPKYFSGGGGEMEHYRGTHLTPPPPPPQPPKNIGGEFGEKKFFRRPPPPHRMCYRKCHQIWNQKVWQLFLQVFFCVFRHDQVEARAVRLFRSRRRTVL